MKIAVSNLAWDMSENDQILDIMAVSGVKGLEIAPKKIFENLESVSDEEAFLYREKVNEAGFDIVAFQAFLFGRPELKLFDDSSRPLLISYIKKVIELAGKLRVEAIVYGAPKSRDVSGRNYNECYGIAVDFFKEVGEYAATCGTTFCIEANALEYGCNFICTARDAARIVRDTDSEGFKLHLDTACMYLAGDDFDSVITDNIDILRHFHVSEPFLKDFSAPKIDHKRVATVLKSAGYENWVSIEMSPSEDAPKSVKNAIDFVTKTYG